METHDLEAPAVMLNKRVRGLLGHHTRLRLAAGNHWVENKVTAKHPAWDRSNRPRMVTEQGRAPSLPLLRSLCSAFRVGTRVLRERK